MARVHCCSTNRGVAVNFGKGKLLYEIDVPREYGGNIKEYSVYQGEEELMFPPFTSFRVNSVQKNHGGFQWFLELTCLGITATPQTSSPEIIIEEETKSALGVERGKRSVFPVQQGPGGEEKNESGESLLFVAAKTAGSEVAMNWLVENGADVNVKNEKDGKTQQGAR